MTDNNNANEFPDDNAKAKFTLADNLHVYYQFPVAESLFSSLLDVLKADAVRPQGIPRSFKPSDHIVFMYGIILKCNADKINEYWNNFLYAMPPPLVYGALWYSDTDQGRELLKVESTCSDKNRASLATLYLAKNKPMAWYEDSSNMMKKKDAIKLASPNALVARLGPDSYVHRLEELWAHWFVTGKTYILDGIILMMDDVNLRKCVAVCESDSDELISEYYSKIALDKVANYDLIMMVGCMMYDKNIINHLKSRLF